MARSRRCLAGSCAAETTLVQDRAIALAHHPQAAGEPAVVIVKPAISADALGISGGDCQN